MSRPTSRPGPVLVVRLGAIGDIVLAMDAFQAIRRHHPASRVIAVTTPPFAGFMGMMPWFDQVWTDDRPKAWRIGAWLALRRRLRAAGFSRIYDLQGARRTRVWHRLFWPGPWPQWVGPVAGASHPAFHLKNRANHVHEGHRLNLLQAGIAEMPPADLAWLDADVAGLALPERFVLLIPGSSPEQAAKRWPAERYGELARRLAGRGLPAVLAGTASDRPAIAAILAAAPGSLDLAGRTSLASLAAVARRAAGVVGNDTGPTHLAAAVGAPTLAIFRTRNNPERSHPWGRNAGWLARDDPADLPVEEVERALRLAPPP